MPNLILSLILTFGILIIGIQIINFLINAGGKSKNNDPFALGLPQGSVRAILSMSLIIFFILLALFFYLDSPTTEKSELAKNILTILGTLVIAVSSFYFGSKATEEGNKIAQETFKTISSNTSKDNSNIPVIVIQQAIVNNKEAWKIKYNCIDVKLGKKKSSNIQFELNCITFVVQTKTEPTDFNTSIPPSIEYVYDDTNFSIPTDVISQQNSQDFKNRYYLLSLEEQYKLVDDYILENFKNLLKTYPSVTGASAAKKQRNDVRLSWVCLQLQVAKKSNSASDQIPPTINFKDFDIPTDVVEASIAKPAFSINPVTDGVSREKDNNYFGSLGFPIYYNGELHLISCYHVLFSKELNNGILSVDNANGDTKIVNSISNDKIGDIVEGQLTDILDVAIMKPTKDLKKLYPKGSFNTKPVYLTRDHENSGYYGIFFGSASKEIKKPDLINISSNQLIEYTIKGEKVIKELYGLVQFERGALEGDSGSAIYDYRDEMVGMIVARDDNFSYAISARNIFKNNSYSLKPYNVNL